MELEAGMITPSWKKLFWRFLRIVVGVYLGGMVLLFIVQRRVIFQPSKTDLADVVKSAKARGFVPWRNSRGEYIGWEKTTTGDHGARILIVHGNAGCAYDRLDYADGITAFLPAEVYVLEYPGYGARAGAPGQASFFAAAEDALTNMGSGGPVYLFGESIGTGVAAYLAGTHPDEIAGVLLLAPYHDLPEVAGSHFPFYPVALLMRDKFPSASYLTNYHGPAAFVLAGHDTVIPNHFGRELFDSYGGSKWLTICQQAEHNDVADQSPEFWKQLAGFWTNIPTATLPTTTIH